MASSKICCQASIIIASLSIVSIAALPEAEGQCGDSQWFSEGLDSFPRESESQDAKPGLVSCNIEVPELW